MMDTLQLIYNKNTINLQAIEKTLIEIKQNSFNYLYKMQLDLTGYKRFNLKMNDLKLINNINKTLSYYPKKYVAFIKEDFIDEKNKLMYKRSQYFNKELSIFDVSNNSKLFTKSFMVFIDGKFFDTINILCKGDTTYIIFDIVSDNNLTGIPYDYFNQLMSLNADISVIFMPNCEYGIYNTNINVLQKYSNQLSLDRFNLVNNLDSEINYITFINDNSLLFSSVITDTENSEGLLKFYDNTINDVENKLIHINVFGFRHLLDQIDIIGTERYFQIPIQDMPLPIENIMIFRNIDGKKYFAHDIQLKMYYPNIYEVINNINDDNLTFYIFYSNDTFIVNEKYENELEIYYKYVTNILEKYNDLSIPEIIKTYEPLEYIYSINDFKITGLDSPIEYKIKTLEDWIKMNNNIFKYYLINQVMKYDGYYLDVSKIDLSSRYRENNHTEIVDELLREEFIEPRYVFIFRNEFSSEYYNLRFFIDGKLYLQDKFYKTEKFEYFYIPVSLISQNSLIEVEKLNKFSLIKQIDINSIDDFILVEIPLLNSLEISANDIFITNDNNEYISRDLFSIYVKNGDNDYVEIINNSFISTNIFFIKLKDDILLSQNMSLYIMKTNMMFSWDIITEENRTESFTINSKLINDKRHFRIFKNGFLLPFYIYDIDFSIFNTTKVNLFMTKNIGDNFIIDITPYKYKSVYEQSEIDNNGFVDLIGILDKPLDFKWYDIYLNGIKLNKNNVQFLSATKMIIKNIQTTKNLVILEKDRDNEIFSIKETPPPLIDKVLGIIEFRNMITSENDDIIDLLPDIMQDVFSLFDVDLYNFYNLYLKFMFINPDIEQITIEMKEQFINLFKDSDILLLNPDIYSNSETYLELNPDIIL